MKKNIYLMIGLFLISITFISCATKRLPPLDPSMPKTETAVLIIPRHITIVTINDENAGWNNGQVRIPAGSHTFTIMSEEKVLVPRNPAFNAIMGTTGNYDHVKQRVGPYSKTQTFEAGLTYTITSRWLNRGTFGSQFAEYTISPYESTYPFELAGTSMLLGYGKTWEGYEHINFGGNIRILSPIVWGIMWNGVDDESDGLSSNWNFSADYLFHKRLFTFNNFYAYIGPGLGLSFWHDGNFVALARAPVGISWWIIELIEISAQFTPSYGIAIPDYKQQRGSWSIDIGIGMLVGN